MAGVLPVSSPPLPVSPCWESSPLLSMGSSWSLPPPPAPWYSLSSGGTVDSGAMVVVVVVVVVTDGVPSQLRPSGRYRARTVSVSLRPSSSQVRVRSVTTRVHDVPRGCDHWLVCSARTQGVE